MARKVQAHHFHQIPKRVLWLMVSGITCDRQRILHSRTPIPPSHPHVPNWFWLGLIWSCSNWQVETAQSSEHSITMIDYISFSWRNWRQPVNDSGIRASSLAGPGASVWHMPLGTNCSVPENVQASGMMVHLLAGGLTGRWKMAQSLCECTEWLQLEWLACACSVTFSLTQTVLDRKMEI